MQAGSITVSLSMMTALEENTVSADAFQQFNLWYEEARQAGEDFPDAMALATVGKDGAPSARVVLLRGVDDGCLVFFTSYTSRKGGELGDNPRAAAVFHWPKLSRQVRAEGSVERASAEESDAYFASRSRESRVAAWAAEQSRVIPDRRRLEERWSEYDARFRDDVPRPPDWGGFRLRVRVMEFWQSSPHRLHDRLRYTLEESGGWRIERLGP